LETLVTLLVVLYHYKLNSVGHWCD